MVESGSLSYGNESTSTFIDSATVSVVTAEEGEIASGSSLNQGYVDVFEESPEEYNHELQITSTGINAFGTNGEDEYNTTVTISGSGLDVSGENVAITVNGEPIGGGDIEIIPITPTEYEGAFNYNHFDEETGYNENCFINVYRRSDPYGGWVMITVDKGTEGEIEHHEINITSDFFDYNPEDNILHINPNEGFDPESGEEPLEEIYIDLSAFPLNEESEGFINSYTFRDNEGNLFNTIAGTYHGGINKSGTEEYPEISGNGIIVTKDGEKML